MALVLALVADLLFGSRVQGALSAAGHDVELIGDDAALRRRLPATPPLAGAGLVGDLTDAQLDGSALIEKPAAAGPPAGVAAPRLFPPPAATPRAPPRAARVRLAVAR